MEQMIKQRAGKKQSKQREVALIRLELRGKERRKEREKIQKKGANQC
jgi:hypothetical protein